MSLTHLQAWEISLKFSPSKSASKRAALRSPHRRFAACLKMHLMPSRRAQSALNL